MVVGSVVKAASCCIHVGIDEVYIEVVVLQGLNLCIYLQTHRNERLVSVRPILAAMDGCPGLGIVQSAERWFMPDYCADGNASTRTDWSLKYEQPGPYRRRYCLCPL